MVRTWLRMAAAFCAAGLSSALLVAPARAALVTAHAGRLASFSGGVSQVNGTFTVVNQRFGSDTQTFGATYSGNGADGRAAGTFNVRWRRGQSVMYGAAFYLPPGFHAATSGQQALVRWDTSPGRGGRIFQGGIVIDYSDNLAYLVSTSVSGPAVTQRILAGPFTVPIGRWFTLQVRQLLGIGSVAYSEVYENGKLAATSRAPNFLPGQLIRHVRFGIVQLSRDAEQGPISLEFDQATAGGYTGYVNPLGGDRYITGRTDMGVDFCLVPGEPIRAVGDGVVVGISPDWFRHQPYIWYQLLDGPYAGRYVYVAEQIRRLARIGSQVSAGQPVAYYKRSGTCIEMGWGSPGWQTLAQATTGYHEGQVTPAGVSYARFLISLGVRGPFELSPTHAKRIGLSRDVESRDGITGWPVR